MVLGQRLKIIGSISLVPCNQVRLLPKPLNPKPLNTKPKAYGEEKVLLQEP